MAEAVVSYVVKRIGDLLTQEATLLSGVREEVEQLQEELRRMQCFLKDADFKQEQEERVRNYVSEIRDVACEAEDLIDSFILKVGSPGIGLLELFFNSLTSIFTKGYHLHQIGMQINSLKEKIRCISDSRTTYGITISSQERSGGAPLHSELPRRTYPQLEEEEEEDIITLHTSTKVLMEQLLTQDNRLRIVSIVGMGGLGKTTLAKKVYNSIEVKRHFDCQAWAFISQQYSIRDVLCTILKEAGSSWQEFERTEDLVKKLHEVLKEKLYLVVLDDIWSSEAWDGLKSAFPKGRKGSKVLFTTRNIEVGSYADPTSPPVELPFLTEEEGWWLLRKKAFAGDELRCTPEFEALGKEIVKECGGLPLAIAVLGGLLARKRSTNKWKMVQRNVRSQLAKLQQQHKHGGINWILALSYNDLPFHLKPCFLYLSQFPEDYEIRKRRLIWMWIAEGFVAQPSSENETMEDVGEGYLEELVSRCMVQVSRRDHTGRGVKTFHLHDLMRDMCVSKAKEQNFLEVLVHAEQGDEGSSSSSSSPLLPTTKSHRISIAPHNDNSGAYFAPWIGGNPLLRSLFCFPKVQRLGMTRRQALFIFKNYKLMRVLCLDRIALLRASNMPREIGNLIQLRYLSLLGTDVFGLPSSIGNMRSLYSLDLPGIMLFGERVPDVVWKLKCLRHLLVDEEILGYVRLDSLKQLETLKSTKAENLITRDAYLNLTNLRTLRILFETSKEAHQIMALNSPIFRLGRLRCLGMMISKYQYMFQFPCLEPLSHCGNLTKLKLSGKIAKLDRQQWQQHATHHHNLQFLPASLTKLSLHYSEIKQDAIPVLKKLPNLRFLLLGENSYRGKEMVFSAHGFPKLEILQLEVLKELEELQIEEGALPCLKTLILYLDKLRMIPDGMKFVTALQELNIDTRMGVIRTRVHVQGPDYYKVKHIPSINFT